MFLTQIFFWPKILMDVNFSDPKILLGPNFLLTHFFRHLNLFGQYNFYRLWHHWNYPSFYLRWSKIIIYFGLIFYFWGHLFLWLSPKIVNIWHTEKHVTKKWGRKFTRSLMVPSDLALAKCCVVLKFNNNVLYYRVFC